VERVVQRSDRRQWTPVQQVAQSTSQASGWMREERRWLNELQADWVLLSCRTWQTWCRLREAVQWPRRLPLRRLPRAGKTEAPMAMAAMLMGITSMQTRILSLPGMKTWSPRKTTLTNHGLQLSLERFCTPRGGRSCREVPVRDQLRQKRAEGSNRVEEAHQEQTECAAEDEGWLLANAGLCCFLICFLPNVQMCCCSVSTLAQTSSCVAICGRFPRR